MERSVLLHRLLELSAELGIEVRELRAAPGSPSDLPALPGVCRLRGRGYLVLDPRDPLEERIALAARALDRFARDRLAARYLPPAVREALEAAAAEAGEAS